MKLNLTKPLVIFDLETTGLDLVKDRIIQISYIKVSPNGDEERGDELVNPERPIEPIITQLTGISNEDVNPIEPIITQLTGISNEDVKDKPTFKQLSQKLADKFTGCDFAGFNSNHFDIPLLAAQTIFHKMERRNLAAAYKFYCGRKMEEDFEAHRADQDTEATYRVLMGELDKYAPGANEDAEKVLENDMDKLAEFSKTNNNVDFAGRIVWGEVKDRQGNPVLDKDGKPKLTEVFNFGKHKGLPVADVLHIDPGYYSWILSGDFTYNTKQVLTRIRLREAKLNG